MLLQLKGWKWNIPYVFFVSDMAIESKATVVSPLRDWVSLFMCNQADVKLVMGKTSQTFFFKESNTRVENTQLYLKHSANLIGCEHCCIG